MPIGYKDFPPSQTKSGLLSREFESLSAVLVRANEWIATSRVNVIHVETVILPNVRLPDGTGVTALFTSGEMGSGWCQIIRIWFETETPPA